MLVRVYHVIATFTVIYPYLSRIIVYSPQIIENYQLQSGEGLSLLFIYIWLLGDLCNVIGASVAQLLPTVIILGIYVGARCITPAGF